MKHVEENRVEFLASKFLEEGLTVKEQAELELLLQDVELRKYFKNLYILWNTPSQKHKNIESAWQRVLAKIEVEDKNNDNNKKNKVSLLNVSWVRTAVASVIAFVLGMSTYYFTIDSQQPLSESRPDQKSVSNKASQKAFNRVSAPLGSKSKIDLPDGTSVVLNAGSTLEYAMDYGTRIREVKLEGEGYFKVAKNKDCPFIVKAKNTSITALGTEFNVKAYVEESIVQTTLVEGMVSINPDVNKKKTSQETILTPNQMLTVHNDVATNIVSDNTSGKSSSELSTSVDKNINSDDISAGKVSMATVNPIIYTSWKDHRWVIEGEEMESLALKLQRRYNVNVVITTPGLKKYKFSGILEDETLEQVLDIMKTIAPVNYYIDKKTVVLSINPEQQKAFEKSMN